MKNIRSLCILAASAVASWLSSNSHAATLTFADGPPVFSSGYTEAGMTLNGGGNYLNVRDWPASPCTLDQANCNVSGEREFLFNDSDPTPSFTLVSNGAFNLLSLDLEDPGATWFAGGTMRVSGSNGATQDVSAIAFGTLLLSGFEGITSFSLLCVGNCQAIVDNIVWEEASSSPVPIPGGLVLFGTVAGFAGLAGWRRQRKISAA